MRQVQATTERVMGRFESYIGALGQGQQTADAFVTHGSQVLSGMITAGQEQTALLQQLKNAQGEKVTHTGSSIATMMVSPSGFAINVGEHIRE